MLTVLNSNIVAPKTHQSTPNVGNQWIELAGTPRTDSARNMNLEEIVEF